MLCLVKATETFIIVFIKLMKRVPNAYLFDVMLMLYIICYHVRESFSIPRTPAQPLYLLIRTIVLYISKMTSFLEDKQGQRDSDVVELVSVLEDITTDNTQRQTVS